jgi:hypothetical protein
MAHSNLARPASLQPLQEYLHLRTQAAELEDHTEACESRDFTRCPLCDQARDIQIRQRRLMELHGDNWAVLLNQCAEALDALLDITSYATNDTEREIHLRAEALIRKFKETEGPRD